MRRDALLPVAAGDVLAACLPELVLQRHSKEMQKPWWKAVRPSQVIDFAFASPGSSGSSAKSSRTPRCVKFNEASSRAQLGRAGRSACVFRGPTSAT